MISRILKWDKYDWKHLIFLLKSLLHGLWKADIAEIAEAYFFLKLHILYDSRRIYPPKEPIAYYLDSESGDDKNDGLTPETAWRTIGKIGNTELQYPCSILFRRGQIFVSSEQKQLEDK